MRKTTLLRAFLDQMLSFDEYFEFIGARAIREREKQFVAGDSGMAG